MRALSASELLAVWERGLIQPSVQRALTLLAAAYPDTPPDTLAELSIGQRDAHLLTLREWAFGPQLVSLATCPGCGERLELTFNVSDIRPSPSQGEGREGVEPSPSGGEGGEGSEPLLLSLDGYEVRFRLPNSLDLAAIADYEDVAASRHLLLERCLLAAQQDGEEATTEQLPAGVLDGVVERMAEADPQADVQLDLTCPSCCHEWQAAFDIVSFFWCEINAWAYRTLREVHTLASAYGWHEADILAMSPGRRRLYFEMVSA